jgi:TetR/AcrR family transcriptional repressor of lmrAB and yxaGH operons
MPRPATGARPRIVSATVHLLRRGGLPAAGLNDVVATSGSPKGSLYHYFPGGKPQMVAEALDAYADLVAAHLADALAGPASLPRRIDALFRSVDARMAGAGYLESCAVGAVVLDLGPEDVGLRAQCARVLAGWAALAAGHLRELPAAKRAAAGRVLVSLLEGAQLAARAAGDGRPLREAARAFEAYATACAARPSSAAAPPVRSTRRR